MSHACFGKYKNPHNCNNCIDLKGCLDESTKPDDVIEPKVKQTRKPRSAKKPVVKTDIEKMAEEALFKEDE